MSQTETAEQIAAHEAFEDEQNENRYREEHDIYQDRGQDIQDHERYEDESESEAEERRKKNRYDEIVNKWSHLFTEVKTQDDLCLLDDLVDDFLDAGDTVCASELNLAICLYAKKLHETA
jgi:hypothetical protein